MSNAPRPEEPLKCLMIQPRFEANNYWNFVSSAQAIGAKAVAPPLGLLTIAAMFPKNWDLKLVDLNVRELTEADWQGVDLVCTGGMLPQQAGIQSVIAECKRRGVLVAVGGPDPTSQPQLYADADFRVLGEGEASIPLWLEAWRNGEVHGTYKTDVSPDVTKTPIPRYELIRFDDYLYTGLQTSRGCPYNCEFCDIIELFGRKPRVKQPDQFVAELERLYQLGYRGWIDIADDNFIGNRLKTKPLLKAVAEWQKMRGYPFVFSTEASINLADDDELLALMSECQFHYVFVGIETPDEQVLVQTQKRINTVKPLIDRVNKIYSSGIAIAAGFIIGFDTEPENPEDTLVNFVQASGITHSMIGLLSALPNTQLTRRLGRERRLIGSDHQWIDRETDTYELVSDTGADQTVGGLNFVTVRHRAEIYSQLRNIVSRVYSPRMFMDRVLSTTRKLKLRYKHVPNGWEFKRMLRGWLVTSVRLLRNRKTRWLYLRNLVLTFWMGPSKFVFANQMMATYPHFAAQTEKMVKSLETSIHYASTQATYPRSVAEMNERLISYEPSGFRNTKSDYAQ